MSITTRKAVASDLKFLLQWGKDLWSIEKKFEPLLKYSKKQSENKYLKELVNLKALFLIAELEEKPIGYLYANLKDIPYYLNCKGEYCELEVVYVESQARQKGVASKLVEELVKWCNEQDAKYITVGIYAKNSPSHEMLTKTGFKNYHLTLKKQLS